MATEWTKLVSSVFKKNRSTNKNYKFKNALMDAKKLYKGTTGAVDTMGPALAKRVAKKLKKTMKKMRLTKKTRRGRRRGGMSMGMDMVDPLLKVPDEKMGGSKKNQHDQHDQHDQNNNQHDQNNNQHDQNNNQHDKQE
jgi:hypothetical protein